MSRFRARLDVFGLWEVKEVKFRRILESLFLTPVAFEEQEQSLVVVICTWMCLKASRWGNSRPPAR